MDGQTRRLQVLQQPYCTREEAFTEGCHPKSVLYILYKIYFQHVFLNSVLTSSEAI